MKETDTEIIWDLEEDESYTITNLVYAILSSTKAHKPITMRNIPSEILQRMRLGIELEYSIGNRLDKIEQTLLTLTKG